MRFIVDQTQTPNLKVKVAILRYIEALARQMDPADFVNSSETRLAVSRIITWTTEPKSSDVRKVRGGASVFCSLLSGFVFTPRLFGVSSTDPLRPFITGRGRIPQADPARWPPCRGRATWRRGASR